MPDTNNTTDNTIIKLKLATSLAVLFGFGSLMFTISGLIFNNDKQSDDIVNVDGRVTKIGSRNAEDIKELQEGQVELNNKFYEFKIEVLENRIKVLENGK